MPRTPRKSNRSSKASKNDSPDESSYHRMEDGRGDWDRSVGQPEFSSDFSRQNPESPSSYHQSRSSTRYLGDRFRKDNFSSSGSVSSFSQSRDFKKMLHEKNDKDPEDEVYLVKQKYGTLSIGFSVAQIGVLGLMMLQCGVAPFSINPMLGPYPDALSEWGGKNAVNILDDGEWWRLVSPIMLHAGVIHLLCNVAVQLETGAFFEREWGSARWLIVYISSAVGSSILSVIFMPDAISVGSSGAVMGLFGAKLAEIICRFCEPDKSEQARVGHQVRKEQCAGVTCSVTLVMLFSFIPYVDWAAHLGGLLAGFCVGMIIFSMDIGKQIWKLFWLLTGIAITVVYFVVTLQHMYSGAIDPSEDLRDVCGYYQQYFEDYECNCMREQNQ